MGQLIYKEESRFNGSLFFEQSFIEKLSLKRAKLLLSYNEENTRE